MGHRLGLATRTQICVCKSPFPSAGTAVSLFPVSLINSNSTAEAQKRIHTPTNITLYKNDDVRMQFAAKVRSTTGDKPKAEVEANCTNLQQTLTSVAEKTA